MFQQFEEPDHEFGEFVTGEERERSSSRSNSPSRPSSAGTFRILENHEKHELEQRASKWFSRSQKVNERMSIRPLSARGFRPRSAVMAEPETTKPQEEEKKKIFSAIDAMKERRERARKGDPEGSTSKTSGKLSNQRKNSKRSSTEGDKEGTPGEKAAQEKVENVEGEGEPAAEEEIEEDAEFEVAVDISPPKEEQMFVKSEKDKALANMLSMNRGSTGGEAVKTSHQGEDDITLLLDTKSKLKRLLENPPTLVYPPTIFGLSQDGESSILCARA